MDESLAFRLTSFEPQAILAPGFIVDSKKAGMLRGQMEDILTIKGRPAPSPRPAFMRIDHGFSLALSPNAPQNRFARGTLLAHHRLRPRHPKRIRRCLISGSGNRLKTHLGILD